METPLKILYSDDALAVVIKPAGILSQSDDRNRPNLPALLQEALGGEVFPVHRLDKETAGVMVFARAPDSAAALSRQFSSGETEKEYLAVVEGRLSQKEGELEDFLFFDRAKNKVFPVKRERKGVKKALLSYRVLEEGENLSLIAVFPKTGRTHQIRVQFASRKHPLYGDRKYSGAGESLGLFCTKLSFLHPKTGEKLSFSTLEQETLPWNLFSVLQSQKEPRT